MGMREFCVGMAASPSHALRGRLASRFVGPVLLGNLKMVVGAALLLAACAGCQGDPEVQGAKTPSTAPGSQNEHQRFLDDFAATNGLEDVPEVDVVRVVTPAESREVVDECVSAQGWSQLPDGTFTYPSEQDEAFSLAMYICLASYPVDEAYTTPIEPQQWSAIYDYWLSDTLPCLAAEGFEVPEPPSKESFLANPVWSPDTPEVREQVAARVSAGSFPSHEYVFTEVCPVMPPDDVRFTKDGATD